MRPKSSTHLDTLRLARPLGAYAADLTADKNEALFLVHAALLRAFSGSPAPSEASLRADIALHAARATEMRATARTRPCS